MRSPPRQPHARAIEPGSTIAQFRVERVISERPGIDTVVEARTASGSRVALTVLGEALAADSERLRETLKLVRVRASIRHPHLVPLRGPRRDHGHSFYVTALASSTTLADRLRAGPLPPGDALRVARQIASALELTASHGLIHRDLTPAAVGMKRGGPIHALLGDFAITSPSGTGCELLATTGAVGYRAPEELRGKPARPRSNVYSLTCILVECLTGERPFPYDPPLLALHAHLVEPPPVISPRGRGLPALIDEVIAQGMAKQPGDRFRSPSQLVEAAGRALGVGERAPAVAAGRKPAAHDKPVARVRRRGSRESARREREHAPRRPRRWRPVRVSAWAAVALVASAAGGFATGSADWSPEKRTDGASRAAAAAEQRLAREQRIEYVETVGHAVERLRKRRADARRELRDARRAARQHAAAKALAVAYRHAREAVPAPPPEGFAGVRLAPALLGAERAYRGLAVAARRSDPKAWQAARRTAVRSDVRITRELTALRATHERLERSASQRSVA
jgi:Protein kinase domain